MLSVTNKPFVLSVIMMNVIMMNVVMLNVVVPWHQWSRGVICKWYEMEFSKHITNLLQIYYKFVTKFLLVSYKFLTNFFQISYKFLTNLLQISYKFLTNLLLISSELMDESRIYNVTLFKRINKLILELPINF
jgi:hypothetical protein